MNAESRSVSSSAISTNRMRHVGLPHARAKAEAKTLLGTGPRKSDDTASLKTLLKVEAETREAATQVEWQYVVANETRKLIPAKQIFVLRGAPKTHLVAISGLPDFERSGKMASGIESIALNIQAGELFDKIHCVDVDRIGNIEQNPINEYPFKQMLWVPFISRHNEIIGAMLLASDRQFEKNEQSIANRLADTYAHALAALIAGNGLVRNFREKITINKWYLLLASLIVLAALMFPVSMSALAPFEVAPRDPVIVASPLEGVIRDILVKPNDVVKKGQKILVFEDTVLNNRYELSQREVRVAAAQLKKASQLAFDDSRGQQEVRAAMANHALKVSTQTYARQMLGRTIIVARRDGVVLFSDRNSLIGRPVKLGERILQIADPANVDLLVDIAVDDSILLNANAQVKVFLDSDPIRARDASIDYIEYQARQRENRVLSFRAVVRLKNQQNNIPGLGVRGTAKLMGKDVPLAFYLFRRPLSAVRQWIGI